VGGASRRQSPQNMDLRWSLQSATLPSTGTGRVRFAAASPADEYGALMRQTMQLRVVNCRKWRYGVIRKWCDCAVVVAAPAVPVPATGAGARTMAQ